MSNRKGSEVVATAVVNRCNFIRRNTTCIHHIVFHKSGNGQQVICSFKPKRQLTLKICPVPALYLLRKMQRHQIVTRHDRRNAGAQTAHRVRGKENISTTALQRARNRPLEPPVEKKRMPRGREKHQGRHIRTVNKAGIVRTIKEKIKLVFRMIPNHPAHYFMRVPAKSLQLARQ